jgi:hypothetical protein
VSRGVRRTVSAAIAVLAVVFTACDVAVADPQAMPAHNEAKTTRGGWRLDLTLANETVNPVPNLAAAANSREAFVNFEATAVASGGNTPMAESMFIAGYQLGCQIDVSSGVQLGGAAAIAPSASLGVGSEPAASAGIGGGSVDDIGYEAHPSQGAAIASLGNGPGSSVCR